MKVPRETSLTSKFGIKGNDVQVQQVGEDAEGDEGDRGDDQRVAPGKENGGDDDRQDVQEIERADDAPGQVDQQGDHQDVEGQLDIEQLADLEQVRDSGKNRMLTAMAATREMMMVSSE